MALTEKGDNINWSLIFERPKTVEEKGGGKERRRGRGREEQEERSVCKRYKVWKLTLSMDSTMDHMDFVWNYMDHMDFLYRYMYVGCGL